MNESTQVVIVTGAKASKGDYEGKPYDSTTIYVQVPLDESTGMMSGFTTVEYKWGKSENYHRISNNEFPFKANVSFQTVSSGRASKVILTHVEPQ